jgi:serine hydrolase
MTKRVFIIHGWEGYPKECWFPWLKKELEMKGFRVHVPSMPDAATPKIGAWVSFLKKKVGVPDAETFFVGHSIGCQTILRYLESLPSHVKVGGVVLVAGWVHLTPAAIEDRSSKKIAKPWLETLIGWKKVLPHTKRFVAIFSDDDPYVPIADSKVFRAKLRSKIIIEKGLKHINGEAGITKLPVVKNELLKMYKK